MQYCISQMPHNVEKCDFLGYTGYIHKTVLPWKISDWKMDKKVKMPRDREMLTLSNSGLDGWWHHHYSCRARVEDYVLSLRRTRTTTRRTMIILTHKKCPGKWANGDWVRPLMRHIFMYLEVILSHPVRRPLPLTFLTYKYIFQRVIHDIKGKCLVFY